MPKSGFPHGPGAAMPPRSADLSLKVSASRAATKCLKASKECLELDAKREEVRKQLKALSAARRKESRKIAYIKKKCSKLKLSELMEIVVLKAVQIDRQASGGSSSSSSSSTGGSSSSSQAWIPTSESEAFARIVQSIEDGTQQGTTTNLAELAAAAAQPEADDQNGSD